MDCDEHEPRHSRGRRDWHQATRDGVGACSDGLSGSLSPSHNPTPVRRRRQGTASLYLELWRRTLDSSCQTLCRSNHASVIWEQQPPNPSCRPASRAEVLLALVLSSVAPAGEMSGTDDSAGRSSDCGRGWGTRKVLVYWAKRGPNRIPPDKRALRNLTHNHLRRPRASWPILMVRSQSCFTSPISQQIRH